MFSQVLLNLEEINLGCGRERAMQWGRFSFKSTGWGFLHARLLKCWVLMFLNGHLHFAPHLCSWWIVRSFLVNVYIHTCFSRWYGKFLSLPKFLITWRQLLRFSSIQQLILKLSSPKEFTLMMNINEITSERFDVLFFDKLRNIAALNVFESWRVVRFKTEKEPYIQLFFPFHELLRILHCRHYSLNRSREEIVFWKCSRKKIPTPGRKEVLLLL